MLSELFLCKQKGESELVAVSTSRPIGGESNTVCGEYMAQHDIRGVSVKMKNGFISIIHDGLEYTIQWSARLEFEDQVNTIIASFGFEN
jgi:hypothetical protein